MTFARTATVALTAGLLFSPAPALAAANHHDGDHRHAGGHRSAGHHSTGHHSAGHAGRTAHLTDRLDHVRTHLHGLRAQLHSAGLTAHQQKVLTGRFSDRDDLVALRRALAHAHGSKQLHRISERIAHLDALVPHQAGVVHLLVRVNGSHHQWQRIDRRLQDDAKSLRENEEDPRVMREFDTAVADLDAAQERLDDDVQALLSASGQGTAALHAATGRVVADLGTVAKDIGEALTALTALEGRLS